MSRIVLNNCRIVHQAARRYKFKDIQKVCSNFIATVYANKVLAGTVSNGRNEKLPTFIIRPSFASFVHFDENTDSLKIVPISRDYIILNNFLFYFVLRAHPYFAWIAIRNLKK